MGQQVPGFRHSICSWCNASILTPCFVLVEVIPFARACWKVSGKLNVFVHIASFEEVGVCVCVRARPSGLVPVSGS